MVPPMDERKSKRLKVLLTEGSSLSARQTLYGLGRNFIVDILDPDPLCQCRFSRFTHRWYRCPSFSKQPAEYLRFLLARLKAEHYDVLLPTHEQVFLLARFGEQVNRHVPVALPDFAAMERLQSKADFCRLLDELDLPYPVTAIIRSRAELEAAATAFPTYVKLAHSTAGSGVRRVENRQELRRVADEFEQAGLFNGQSETLVQAPAVGVQSTVQAVCDRGRVVAAHCFEARHIGVGGMSSARVSACHPLVFDHVARLAAHVGWHGATFIDYFYDAASGQPQYIEANPRIGETVNALLCGVNLPQALVDVSLGREPPPPPAAESRPTVLTHSGFMILMALAEKGASRRQLVAEKWRQRRGHGIYENSRDELTRPAADWMSLLPAAFVTAQLLVKPANAHRMIKKTVDNYSLPEAAVRRVREISDREMQGVFGG